MTTLWITNENEWEICPLFEGTGPFGDLSPFRGDRSGTGFAKTPKNPLNKPQTPVPFSRGQVGDRSPAHLSPPVPLYRGGQVQGKRSESCQKTHKENPMHPMHDVKIITTDNKHYWADTIELGTNWVLITGPWREMRHVSDHSKWSEPSWHQLVLPMHRISRISEISA